MLWGANSRGRYTRKTEIRGGPTNNVRSSHSPKDTCGRIGAGSPHHQGARRVGVTSTAKSQGKHDIVEEFGLAHHVSLSSVFSTAHTQTAENRSSRFEQTTFEPGPPTLGRNSEFALLRSWPCHLREASCWLSLIGGQGSRLSVEYRTERGVRGGQREARSADALLDQPTSARSGPMSICPRERPML